MKNLKSYQFISGAHIFNWVSVELVSLFLKIILFFLIFKKPIELCLIRGYLIIFIIAFAVFPFFLSCLVAAVTSFLIGDAHPEAEQTENYIALLGIKPCLIYLSIPLTLINYSWTCNFVYIFRCSPCLEA